MKNKENDHPVNDTGQNEEENKNIKTATTDMKEEEKRRKKEARKAKREARRAKRRAQPIWLKCLKVVIPIVIILIAAVVIKQNYRSVTWAYLNKELRKVYAAKNEPEEVYDITPPDAEGAARVEALPIYDEKDTWAVYIYMCGSNLESCGLNELSDVTKYLIKETNAEFEAQQQDMNRAQILSFVDELDRQGLDLPKFMYSAQIDQTDEDSTEQNIQTDGAATHDLKLMLNVALPENVKVIIQTGGANRWQSALVNPNRSDILLYDADGIRQIEDNHIRNMGDPATLADFMQYCQDNYPADHEVLLLYDHGGGPFGMCWDEVYADDNLTLNELQEALQQVYGENPKEKPFELIATHACLMSNLDVIKLFAPYGNYFCGSEEVSSDFAVGEMEYYLLEELGKGSATNGARIGKEATDIYVNLWGRMGKNELLGSVYRIVTDSSVIDLNKAEALYNAYDALMARALEDAMKDPASMTRVAQAAGQSVRFAADSANAYNLIDLGLFMDALAQSYPAETASVKSALEESVLYHRGTYEFRDTQGVSVYFPVDISDIYGLKKYLNYINDISNSESTKAFYYYKMAGCLNSEFTDYVQEKGYGSARVIDTSELKQLQNETVRVDETGNYHLNPKIEEMDFVQDCYFVLAQYDEAQENVVYLGNSKDAVLNENDGLSTDFDCSWITMDDHLLATEVIDHVGDLTRYRSPVMINRKDYYLILGQDDASGEVSLLGIAQNSEKAAPDMSGRALLELKEGDKITPVYECNSLSETDNPNTINQVEGESFKFKTDTKFALEKLSDGAYLTAIEVTDLRGDKYTTAVVELTIKDGKVAETSVRTDMMNEVY